MSPAEREARIAAAAKRILAVSPSALDTWNIAQLRRVGVNFLLHLSVGFGVADQTEISAWFGLLLALVSANTIGRFWEWVRRDAVVKAIEDHATEAERRAREGVK